MLIILADNAAWCRSNAFENVPASTSLEIHSSLSLPPAPNSTIPESDGVSTGGVNAIESPPVVAEPAVTALEEVAPDNTTSNEPPGTTKKSKMVPGKSATPRYVRTTYLEAIGKQTSRSQQPLCYGLGF